MHPASGGMPKVTGKNNINKFDVLAPLRETVFPLTISFFLNFVGFHVLGIVCLQKVISKLIPLFYLNDDFS